MQKRFLILCLVILSGFLFSSTRLLAQEVDEEVEVTEFSTAEDSLEILSTESQTVEKQTPDPRAIESFADIKINWDSLRAVHSPRRAALYSAVLPGLGQIYNRQFIKAPLMLGGIGTAAGIFIFNFEHYTTFRDAYRLRLDNRMTGDPKIDIYPNAQDLKDIRDGYRQYVDYSVLGFAAVYLYNVLDAVVFAHLFNFNDQSPLSKMNFGPVLHERDPYLGFGFTYNF